MSDLDHHCVFFSKCIGGGNICCFWGSIGMLIFNFVLMGILVVISGAQEAGMYEPPRHKRHSMNQ